MKDLLDKMIAALVRGDRVNYRDRRGHYASGNLTCLRDQYWGWTKEPETNPTDFTGAMKMLVGSAVEDGLVKSILSKLGPLGYFLRGTQVPVGGSNPNWDGYLDGLLVKQVADGKWEHLVTEIKTKSGYGADLFNQNPEPSLEYMTQLGLYLKDLHEKGVTNKGLFIFVLLSDKTFGTLVLIEVTYDEKTCTASASDWVTSDGRSGTVSVSVDLKAALERWKLLDQHINSKTLPKGEYQYKYPLTPEVLTTIPDAKLKKIIDGQLIYGDWQPMYSRFKQKALEIDGAVAERTPEEILECKKEYRRRHPRTKI